MSGQAAQISHGEQNRTEQERPWRERGRELGEPITSSCNCGRMQSWEGIEMGTDRARIERARENEGSEVYAGSVYPPHSFTHSNVSKVSANQPYT